MTDDQMKPNQDPNAAAPAVPPQPVSDPNAFSVEDYQPPAADPIPMPPMPSDVPKPTDAPAQPSQPPQSAPPAPQATQTDSVIPGLDELTQDVIKELKSHRQNAGTGSQPAESMPSAPASEDKAAVPQPSQPAMPQPPAQDDSSSEPAASQSLESQNIFALLGVTDATEEEKEAFLDELQDVIWEDFLAGDVELLITDEEMKKLNEIQQRTDLEPEALQEEVVVYLDTLIPDLEQIMLEKALELKEDMVRERAAGLKEYFEGYPDSLAKVEQAVQQIEQGSWRDAAETMNQLVAKEVDEINAQKASGPSGEEPNADSSST